MEPSDIKSMDFDELRAELAALGEKEFRAAQIYDRKSAEKMIILLVFFRVQCAGRID